jgi:hypothetical protein
MVYRCDTCDRIWDNQIAADNDFHCTRRCGGRLVLIEASQNPGVAIPSSLPPTDHLPYPAALAVERLRTALAAGDSAWDRVSLFKDAVETTVKSLCVYGLGTYLISPGRSAERDEILLDLLVRPSTGHWVELLGVVCKYLRDAAAPCHNLYSLFFDRRGERDEPTACYQTLRDFVPFRNDLHHSARRPSAEYERALQGWLPRFAVILEGTVFLAQYSLLIPETPDSAQAWSGVRQGQTTAG